MEVYFAVDRVEGRIAVIEYQGQLYDVPAQGMREGQVYRWTGRRWVRDRREEARRRASVPRLIDRSGGGNIQL